jgi:hypothetical protein
MKVTDAVKLKAKTPEAAGPRQGITEDLGKTEGTITSVSSRIKSLEQLLKATSVNMVDWEVDRCVVNKWEVGAKNKAKVIVVEPLFQVKAWLKRRVALIQARTLINGLLDELKKSAPRVAAIGYGKKADGHLFEPSMPDIHVGKLAWGAENGGKDWDLRIAESTQTNALESLIHKSQGWPITRVLFPVGNDLYNVDNAASTTAAGTPQDEDGRWQKSFSIGKRMMIRSILRLREIAPVDVLMVGGNHDVERLFYLGEVLESYFGNIPGVTINNSPAQRKYYRFGKCLLGFTHGNNEKHATLPIIMAQERSQDWAETKHREWHLGHYHCKKEMHFNSVAEHNAIRIRTLPSLTAADAWHTSKGYEAMRSAEGYLWHPTGGNVGYVAHNL